MPTQPKEDWQNWKDSIRYDSFKWTKSQIYLSFTLLKQAPLTDKWNF